MSVIGIDVGGANLKAASTEGQRAVRSFALWREPERLTDELRSLLDPFTTPRSIAVTMTAELADCFTTKSNGVRHVLTSVQAAVPETSIHVWQTGAEFVAPEVAVEIPLLVAAANWHALATWLGRLVPEGPAILVDVGSTTTDIIPLLDGRPIPVGMTDCERLQAGELLYTGARRTPLCALVQSVPFRDGQCGLAAELFATTHDVRLILSQCAEDPTDSDTANGRPATRRDALDRLARMLCCDLTEVSEEELTDVARFLSNVQQQRIRGCIDRVTRRLAHHQQGTPQAIVSGSGADLALRVLRDTSAWSTSPITDLRTLYDEASAEVACALAVARLADERT